jgi:uncharacterized protein (DUF885 family)
MQKTSIRKLNWLAIVAITLLSACADVATERTPAYANTMSATDLQLHRIVDDYFEEMLRRNPIIATYVGDPRYNDRLANDISPRHVADMVALHRRYLDAAKKLDTSKLSAQSRLTYSIFARECNEAIEGAQFPSYLMPIDQMGGLPANFAELGAGENAQPFNSVRDYENFLKRGVDFSAWVDQAIDNMRAGVKRGYVQPRVVMQKVVPQLEAMLVEDVTASLFYGPVKKFPAAISAADQKRLTAAYKTAIAQRIVPAYRRLRDFIRDEYLPHTRDTVAWTALPNGNSWYQFLSRHYTTTELSAAEIHRIGLSEVARIRGEMSKVQTKLGVPGDLAAFFKHLENDQSQYFESGEQLLAAHRALKAKIDAKLPTLFVDFPKADYEIREVEAFRAQSAAGAFYQPPSADGARSGIFYVNTFNLKAQPKFGMTTLSLHEASPGHHFQISIQQEIADMPRFRRFLVGYTAYVEGWALYTESLGNEMALFDDPYQYFGHLNDEMLRAMRLVVDTGLHTANWSREQAIRYMLDNSYMAPSDAEAEVERYIATPGQALGYKIGQLRIRALRTQAEQALGSRFDVKQFHSQVLRDGPLPMDVLATKIDDWTKQH